LALLLGLLLKLLSQLLASTGLILLQEFPQLIEPIILLLNTLHMLANLHLVGFGKAWDHL
jgi:hypothetical protein